VPRFVKLRRTERCHDLDISAAKAGRRLPAMTGKALFRRLAAERRHGDVPGNGEGDSRPHRQCPCSTPGRVVPLQPQPSLPLLLTSVSAIPFVLPAPVPAADHHGRPYFFQKYCWFRAPAAAYPDGLTQALVREFLDYDFKTGALTWRWRDRKHFPVGRNGDRHWKSFNARFAGKPAFTSLSNGYHNGAINYVSCLAHRIIWLLVTGHLPLDQLDHEDHDRGNNRWANLSESNNPKNGKNTSLHKNNTSGYHGVKETDNGRYTVRINSNYEVLCLGTHDTFDEAVSVRQAAEREHGFHKNHGKPKS
jgi:HNH endonuclease